MKKTLPTLVLPLILAAFSIPAFADGRTDDELNQALGNWVVNSIHAGMHDPELMDALWNKAADLLGKDDRKAAHIPETIRHRERAVLVERDMKVEKKGGPPPWAPAHGWRNKFGHQQERELGHYITARVEEGIYGSVLIDLVHKQIKQVSLGGKIGDNLVVNATILGDSDPEAHGSKNRGNRGKTQDKQRGKKH
ncbi:MAG: hypothetical protein VCD00_20615 [Candidatus Hydrogenedentota bacterium]